MKKIHKRIALFIAGFCIALLGLYLLLEPKYTFEPLSLNKPAPTDIIIPGNSSIVIIEYSDFQCPACARFSEVLKELQQEYDFTVVYRPFPLTHIHEHATLASAVALSAYNQGKFIEMHDILFSRQDEWSNANAKELFTIYAQEIGLDMNQFESNVSSAYTKQLVQHTLDHGKTIGVRGTPTIYINGKLNNLRTYEDLKKYLDTLATR
jgi:protein-disulfide isomerase